MSKSLQEQMNEAVYKFVDNNEDSNLSDSDWIETTKSICTRVAQIYALEQQIQLLEKIGVRDRFRATYHDLQFKLKQLQEEQS
jgi:hypothetical protein